jgi:hypothetical protein
MLVEEFLVMLFFMVLLKIFAHRNERNIQINRRIVKEGFLEIIFPVKFLFYSEKTDLFYVTD